MPDNNTICGRPFEVHPPQPQYFFVGKGNKKKRHTVTSKKARARITVAGMNHPGGSPIRYKSRERAEAHIKAMGKEAS